MKKLGILILISIMHISLSAANEDIYYGAGVVKTSWDEDIIYSDGSVATIKYDKVNAKFFIGVWLVENIAAEFQYIGFNKDDNADNNSIQGNSIGSSLLYYSPINDSGSVFAKIGFHSWDNDVSSGGVTISNDGNNVLYGVGIDMKMINSISARLEFEALEFGNTNTGNFGLSIVYNF